jgi:hypothetical protein
VPAYKTLAVQIPHRRADYQLNLLVDSTECDHSDPEEWTPLERGLLGSDRQKRNPARHPALRPCLLEKLNRISRPEPDRGEDAVPESLRRAHCRTAPRQPDGGIQIRVALINRFNSLGTAEIVRVG